MENLHPEVQRLLEQRPKSRANAERINRIKDPFFREELIELAMKGASHATIRQRISEWHQEQKEIEASEMAARAVAPAAALRSLVRQANLILPTLWMIGDDEIEGCRAQFKELQQIVDQMDKTLGE